MYINVCARGVCVCVCVCVCACVHVCECACVCVENISLLITHLFACLITPTTIPHVTVTDIVISAASIVYVQERSTNCA